ncbi:MAG: helix-turn-helix domain-containing protein [Candidatus Hodarchaeales archaeon]
MNPRSNNNGSSVSDEEIISSLKGKTLQVYWFMLRRGQEIGVRELQRELDFSSPSVASYHLEKLRNLELVEKNSISAYYLTRKANIGLLNQFIVVRIYNTILTLPRYFFYAVFMLCFFLGYLIFFFRFPPYTSDVFAFTFGLLSNLFLWFETWKTYREKPF